MADDDVRKPPQRYRQRVRVVAVIVSGAFALPVLFVFGVTLRELSRPPEPSIYAAPSTPPEPTPAIPSPTAVPEGSSPSTEGPSLPLPPLPEAP
ncbi:MAG: hypothetical protein OXF67_03595 [Cyanobacteria bacterium MAG CAR4_bin_6]|nr:hypothetical protein [Cyanobacteria bacterium MAG CAR4_bin_6]MCY4236196.1 hypothetical protein [Cyanobacteria bacterium MAG CAR2_bin_4]